MEDAVWDCRRTLAANLRYVMDNALDQELRTSKGLERRTGISYKTIDRMLRPDPEKPAPNLESIVPVAKAFGLSAWHVLRPRTAETPVLPHTPLMTGSEGRISEPHQAKTVIPHRSKRRN